MDSELISFSPQDKPNANTALARRLKHSEEVFRLLVSSVNDYAIFLLDPDGYVMTWNGGAEKINGYSADEIIGKHFSTFYTREARESLHPQYKLEVAKKAGRYEEEGWRLRKDGSAFWSNVVITALNDGGELLGFAKVTRDLTERKQAEEMRERNSRRLAEANEELQRLAYVVSHELQGPISRIVRYTGLLNARYKDRLGNDANEFMAYVNDGAKLTARIVDDLWTYARIARPDVQFEACDMEEILSKALASVRRNVTEFELTHGELPIVQGHAQQLVYLLTELINNAIRYRGPDTPHVHVSADLDEGNWIFSVKDNGQGIDRVHQADVFKVFHRLHGQLEPEATGMGLARCKKIVQQHRGRMWCESDYGQGCTFKFSMPNPLLAKQHQFQARVKKTSKGYRFDVP